MTLDTSWQGRKATPKQYKGLLAAVGLNQTSGARYFGVSMRTMRRMCAGKSKIPVATVLLMHLMCKHGEEPEVPPARKRRR